MIDVTTGAQMAWILSTSFGKIVFTLVFLTWGLIIVNLFLLMLVLVHRIARGYAKKQDK